MPAKKLPFTCDSCSTKDKEINKLNKMIEALENGKEKKEKEVLTEEQMKALQDKRDLIKINKAQKKKIIEDMTNENRILKKELIERFGVHL